MAGLSFPVKGWQIRHTRDRILNVQFLSIAICGFLILPHRRQAQNTPILQTQLIETSSFESGDFGMPSNSGDGADTIIYLQSMLVELEKLAASERLQMLAYLIGMAHGEAGDIIAGQRRSRVRRDQRDSAS